MNNTREVGWGKFLKGFPWYNQERKYPLQAYSEFMPPVRTGINPVDGSVYPWVFRHTSHCGMGFGWDNLDETILSRGEW